MALRSDDPKLITRVINFVLVQPICPRYLNVTDRQTDGRTTYDSNTALELRASRGKNCKALDADKKKWWHEVSQSSVAAKYRQAMTTYSYDTDGGRIVGCFLTAAADSTTDNAAIKQAGCDVDQVLSGVAGRISRHSTTGHLRVWRGRQVRPERADRYCPALTVVRS